MSVFRLQHAGIFAAALGSVLVAAAAEAQSAAFVEEAKPQLPALLRGRARIAMQGPFLLVASDEGVGSPRSFYSFSRAQDHWAYEATVVGPSADVTDAFASSLALDGETALIGAPGTGTNGVTQVPGSAYVFLRSGTGWAMQQKLTAPDGANNDHFGDMVAVSGDLAFVSAPEKTIGGIASQGAIYVFVRSGTTWAFEQQITAPSPAVREFFGRDIAVHGNTLLAGLSARTIGANSRQGVAFVFVRSGTTWQLQQTLTAPDGEASDAFGAAVAIERDTAIVCAPLADAYNFDNHGAGYVFTRAGATWTQQQKISTMFSDSSIQRFALAVALEGDTAMLAAPAYHDDRGGVFVYTRSGSSWSEVQEIRAEVQLMEEFGVQLTLSGNVAVIPSTRQVFSFRRAAASDMGDASAMSTFDADDAAPSPGSDAPTDDAAGSGVPIGNATESGGCGCRVEPAVRPPSSAMLSIAAVGCSVLVRRKKRPNSPNLGRATEAR